MFTQAQFLSQEGQQIIHNESIRILKEVGVLFHSKKALDILKKNGAKVDYADNIAKIPEEMVNTALQTAPKSFVCGARISENDFALPSTYSGYVQPIADMFWITAVFSPVILKQGKDVKPMHRIIMTY